MAERQNKNSDFNQIDIMTDGGKAIWFDTNKGNMLQFLGILMLTTGVPLLFFPNSRVLGFIFCPVGIALYLVGRFANWYFWYRLQ